MKKQLKNKIRNFQVVKMAILGLLLSMLIGCQQINDLANSNSNGNTTVEQANSSSNKTNNNELTVIEDNGNSNKVENESNQLAESNSNIEKTVNDSQEETTPNLITSLTMTDKVGQGNAPIGEKTVFSTSDSIIYAVFEIKNVPVGTKLHSIWLSNGNKLEETAPITANQEYKSVYVEFHLQSKGSATFASGSYEVQIYVNDKLTKTGQFTVK